MGDPRSTLLQNVAFSFLDRLFFHTHTSIPFFFLLSPFLFRSVNVIYAYHCTAMYLFPSVFLQCILQLCRLLVRKKKNRCYRELKCSSKVQHLACELLNVLSCSSVILNTNSCSVLVIQTSIFNLLRESASITCWMSSVLRHYASR